MTLKIHHHALVLFGLLVIEAQAANDPTPSPVRVSEVAFSQGTALTFDEGGTMPPTQWEDKVNNADQNDLFPDGQPDKVANVTAGPNAVKSYAYSYVSNKRPMVAAVFKWKTPPPEEGKPYSAKGEVVNSPNCEFKLPKTQLAGNTSYPATVTAANIVTARKIQGYVTPNRKVARSDGTTDLAANLGPVTIEWTVYDKNDRLVGTSRSTHTIYVTWDEPATTLRQETLFNLACETSNGMTIGTDAGKAVFDKIWTEFSDREVKRMDSVVMGYYSKVPFVAYTNLTSVPELIDTADGPCQKWASLLRETSRVHGDNPSKISKIEGDPVTVNEVAPTVISMIVKDHTCAGAPPYQKEIDANKDITRNAFSPAQGTIKPAKDVFADHAVVRFGTSEVIYDASYGKKPDNIRDWENISLSFTVGIYKKPGLEFHIIFDRANSVKILDL